MILCGACRADITREEFYLCNECSDFPDLLCERDAEDHEHDYFTEYGIGRNNKIEELAEMLFLPRSDNA